MAVGVSRRRRTTNGIQELGAMRVTQPRAGRLGRRTGVGGCRLFIFLRSPAGGVADPRRDIVPQRPPPPPRLTYRPDRRCCPRAAGNPKLPLPSSFAVQVHPEPERKGTSVVATFRLCGPGLGRTVPPRRCLSWGRAGKLP